MWVAAPTCRRAVIAATVAFLAAAWAAPAQAATRVDAEGLPKLWGVEVRVGSKSELAAERLQGLRFNGVNTLVLDARRLNWDGIAAVGEVASANSLQLVVAFPEKGSGHHGPRLGCKVLEQRVPQAACAVLARTLHSAGVLARTRPASGPSLVVAKFSDPAKVPARLRRDPTARRIVALTALRGKTFAMKSWTRAMNHAAASSSVDLSVAAVGTAAQSQLGRYLSLLQTRRETPPVSANEPSAQQHPAPFSLGDPQPSAAPPSPSPGHAAPLAPASGPVPAPPPTTPPGHPAPAPATPTLAPPVALPPAPPPPAAGGPFVAVATSGSDSSCVRGDRSRPCQSFGRAYAVAQPGDTVEVACGSYPSQAITRGSQPQNGPVIAFRAASPLCARVSGWFALGTDNGGESGNAPNYLTIDGIEVSDGSLWTYWNAGPANRGLTLSNMRLSDSSNAADLISLGSWDGLTLQNIELGPACCQGVGVALGRANFGAPQNRNITISGLYIHDIYDTCSPFPGACSGVGFGSGCASCRHIDGIQVTDAHDITISNTRIERLNGASGQGIFFAAANGGTFSNILLQGNTVGNLPQDDILVSGPGNGIVSGYVRILNNMSYGNIIVYGDPPNNLIVSSGTEVTFSGNTGDLGTSNEANRCVLVLSNGSTFRPTWVGNTNTMRSCD